MSANSWVRQSTLASWVFAGGASLVLLGPSVGSAQPEPRPEPRPRQQAEPSPEADEDEAAPEEREAERDAAPEAPAAPSLQPPRLLESPPPDYPMDRLEDGLHPTVVLLLTLDREGQVVEAHVEHSADADFDTAARAAVHRWRFAPATRSDEPIPSRIRVAVHFELPGFDLAHVGAGADLGAATHGHGHEHEHRDGDDARPDEDPTPAASESSDEAVQAVQAVPEEQLFGASAEVDAPEDRARERGASTFELDGDLLQAAPRRDGGDLVNSVPGVFAARAEGLAVGHRITLRGFDAEHGQDIELRVGGLPINVPSHIHGQGYADLGFLIGDVVQSVGALEGVYDPRQGDFAVAGTLDFTLGVPDDRRGWRVATSYGRFDTVEQLVLFAPEGEREETFAAVQLGHTAGYGDNRGGDSIRAIVQVGAEAGRWRVRGLGIVYGARAGVAGVVRVADVEDGTVGFYDSYALPTAQNQSALAGRFIGGVFGDYRGTAGDAGGLGVWLQADVFRIQENFTGFIQRSRTLANVAGRGDLIEQRNRTVSLGLDARYRTAPWEPTDGAEVRLELGTDGRVDMITQEQNLLGNRNQTWDRRVDAEVFGTQAGLWGDLEFTFAERVRLNAGVRASLLLYEVEDRLGNFVPTVRPTDSFIMGFRRSAAGFAVGPRTSAAVEVAEGLSLHVAYGEGFRSPQARTLDDGEEAPFTKVRSADVGATWELDDLLRLSVAGYWTRLSDDIAFEPREGRQERVGASRRLGATIYLQANPVDWMVGALSLTYVDAELLEPPPATADDPEPAFKSGQNLPYVPPVVLRLDLGAEHELARIGGRPLTGKLGAGYSYLSPRPLPFGGFAEPVHLVDASATLRYALVDVGVSLFNLLDNRYAASEFVFTSNWAPEGVPSRVPSRHLSAGAPFTFLVTVGVEL